MNTPYHSDGLAVNAALRRRGKSRGSDALSAGNTALHDGLGGSSPRSGEHDVLDKTNPAPSAPPFAKQVPSSQNTPAGFVLSSGSPERGGGSPSPSFYAVIPATVRYCKGLPSSAKLLYGEITALCQLEGYCWAGSDYFAGLYSVDRSTVKRWLDALVRFGFVVVEVNRDWPEQRRIYLAEALPQLKRVAQKRATGGAKMQQGWRKNAPQSITENNTKSTTTFNVEKGVAPQHCFDGEKVAASPQTVQSLKEGAVAAVVALTHDAKSERRFGQLYDLADAAHALPDWDAALLATRMALERPRKPVQAPGAYFQGILSRSLNGRGVAVPVGTPSERAEVRSLIAQSLGGEVSE